jgi:hypothetical protein
MRSLGFTDRDAVLVKRARSARYKLQRRSGTPESYVGEIDYYLFWKVIHIIL